MSQELAIVKGFRYYVNNGFCVETITATCGKVGCLCVFHVGMYVNMSNYSIFIWYQRFCYQSNNTSYDDKVETPRHVLTKV